jgi:hypothetical protein
MELRWSIFEGRAEFLARKTSIDEREKQERDREKRKSPHRQGFTRNRWRCGEL